MKNFLQKIIDSKVFRVLFWWVFWVSNLLVISELTIIKVVQLVYPIKSNNEGLVISSIPKQLDLYIFNWDSWVFPGMLFVFFYNIIVLCEAIIFRKILFKQKRLIFIISSGLLFILFMILFVIIIGNLEEIRHYMLYMT